MSEREIAARYTKYMNGSEITRIFVLAQLTGYSAARILSILNRHGIDVSLDRPGGGRMTCRQMIDAHDMLEGGMGVSECARTFDVPYCTIQSLALRLGLCG